MKKRVTQSTVLLLLSFWGWINLSAAPPVVFYNKGAVQVSEPGKMYVKGGMHMNPGAAVTQNGLTVLTGDFIHDAFSNVFTTNYSTVTGTVEFRGNTDQMVTTRLEAYTPAQTGGNSGKMDRKNMFLKFPDFKINNGNRVIVTPSMGVSVNNLIFDSEIHGGRLRLKSDSNVQDPSARPDDDLFLENTDQDASLLVEGIAIGYKDSTKTVIGSGDYMEIERNVRYNRGRVADDDEPDPIEDPMKFFGFSAPLNNIHLDYFTDHFVFDQRLNGGEGDYNSKRWNRFEPGVGYFIIIREVPHQHVNPRPQDNVVNGMYIQNEHFIFNRTFYPDFFTWGFPGYSEEGQPQEVLNTDNVTVPLKTGENYLGNPYTCALDVKKLFAAWNGLIKPEMKIWSGYGGNWLTLTPDMSTTDDPQPVIPSQQMFCVEGLEDKGNFEIPKSARTHNAQRYFRSNNTFRNELLIEVRDAELENFSRMVIGLRSWGELSGEDQSDSRFLQTPDGVSPQLFAVVPHKDSSVPYDTLTINSLPEDVTSSDFDFVPSFKKKGNRKYIMNFRRQESLETEMAVLIDKKTKMEINIWETSSYEFYADMNDDTQRFAVLFKSPTQIEEANLRPRDAYLQNQTLYIIHNQESDIRKPVEIYNASGMLVYKNEIVQAGTNTYELNLAEGVYIVRSGEMVKKIRR